MKAKGTTADHAQDILNIYKSMCLPRALNGCELMTNLTRSETNILEVTYRFCLKYMQNISKRTKTNMFKVHAKHK